VAEPPTRISPSGWTNTDVLGLFVRSFGTQFTLGVFVATFLYSLLALIAISQQGGHASVRPTSR